MPAIVVLMLAAVFAAGGLLAAAPVQERAEVQVHVIPEAGSIPAVAGCRKCGQHQQWEWERLQRWRDWESWQQDWRAWAQGPEFKAAARRDALECLRRILPDADESALESALENAANCVQCPQICRHSSRDDPSEKSGRNFLLRSNWDKIYIPVSPYSDSTAE